MVGMDVSRMSLLQRLVNSDFMWVHNRSDSDVTVYFSPTKPMLKLLRLEVASHVGGAGMSVQRIWERVQARTTRVVVTAGDTHRLLATQSDYYISIQRRADSKWYCVDMIVKRGHIITVKGTQ